jgi:hypothetical protein
MKTKIIEVNCCGDCPFLDWSANNFRYFCLESDYTGESIITKLNSIAEGCALKDKE